MGLQVTGREDQSQPMMPRAIAAIGLPRHATMLAMLLAAIAPGIASAQSNDAAPPPLLKGGIVHQLRSLSEGAKNALDAGFSRNRSQERSRVSLPPRLGGRPSSGGRSNLPPQIPENGPLQDGKRLALRQPAVSIPEPQQRSIAHPSADQPSHRMAEVVRPEDFRAPASQQSSAARAGMQVFVEDQIPEEVLRSFQRVKPSPAEGADNAISQTPEKPRVSRIPLPGGARPKQPPKSNEIAQSNAARSQASTASKPTTPQKLPPSTPVRVGSELGVEQPAAGVQFPVQDVPKVARRSPPALSSNSPSSLPPATLPATALPPNSTPTQNQAVALPNIPSLSGPNPLADASSSNSTATSLSGPAPSLPSGPVGLPEAASLPPIANAGSPSAGSPSGPLPFGGLPTEDTNAAAPALSAPPSGLPNRSLPPALPPSVAQSPKPPTSTVNLPPAAISTKASGRSPADNDLRNMGSPSTTRMSMVTPKIHVVLDGPADIPVGRAAEYRIIVRNEDSIQLQGLLLQMEVPAGVVIQPTKPSRGRVDLDKGEDGSTLVSWTFEALPGEEQAVAPIMLTAAAPKNFPVAMEWTLLPMAELAHISVKAARLELALEGPSEVQFGKANTYRLHVRNPGNAPARNVEVALTAEQYGSSSSTIGDIAAGGEETIDVELTFNQRGAIEIAAAANSGSSLKADSKISVLVRKAELSGSLTTPQLVYHGTPVPVRLTARNTGDAVAENVTAEVQLPPGAEPVSLPPSAHFSAGVVRCELGNVAAGASMDFNFTAKLQTQGQNVFKLLCQDAAGNSTNGTSSTRVEAIADLVLLVSDPIAPAPVQSEVAYELTLTNRGSKAARDVRVLAQFSDGIEPLRGVGLTFRIVPGQLFFDAIPSVAAGETVRLKVFAKASEGGMHRFRAEVRTEEEQMRLVQEEATQYLDQVSRSASLPTSGTIR